MRALDVRTDAQLPDPLGVTAYFVVSEALTNAAKHSHASVVQVGVDTAEGRVLLSITDDGIGSKAAPGQGTRLSVELLLDHVRLTNSSQALTDAYGRDRTANSVA